MRTVTSADGVRIAVHSYGDPSAPVLVCVHGYPDNARMWRQVATALADRFHVVAYDVRGAGESGRPRSRAAYRLARLEDDFVAVLDAVSPTEPVHVLAHDWGSIQCWHFLTGDRLSGRVASFVSVAGPCLDHVAAVLRGPIPGGCSRRVLRRQLLRWWYVVFFRLPWLPELGWRTGLSQWLLARSERMGRDQPTPPGERSVADFVDGLQLYRANVRDRMRHPEPRVTAVPVLSVAAADDPFVLPELQTGIAHWASDLRVEVVSGGHWLPRNHPEQLAALTAAHIDAVSARPAE